MEIIYHSYDKFVDAMTECIMRAINESCGFDDAMMTDDEFLLQYGITLFSANESVGINLQKYKHGVVLAIRKLRTVIGDKSGTFIKNTLSMAKKGGYTTLAIALIMICAYGGEETAYITEREAKNFIADCVKMYDVRNDLADDIEKMTDTTNHVMTIGKNKILFPGYGEGKTKDEALANAKKLAMSRAREDNVDLSHNDILMFDVPQKVRDTYRCQIVMKAA